MGLRGGHLVARFVFGCWAQGSPLAPTFFSVLFFCLVVFGDLSGGDAISSFALLDFPNFCVLSALAGAFRYVWDYNCCVLVCLWWFAVFRFGLWVLSFWCIWPSDAGSRIGCGDLVRSWGPARLVSLDWGSLLWSILLILISPFPGRCSVRGHVQLFLVLRTQGRLGFLVASVWPSVPLVCCVRFSAWREFVLSS